MFATYVTFLGDLKKFLDFRKAYNFPNVSFIVRRKLISWKLREKINFLEISKFCLHIISSAILNNYPNSIT